MGNNRGERSLSEIEATHRSLPGYIPTMHLSPPLLELARQIILLVHLVSRIRFKTNLTTN
ncbi:MAG: hypothetical protein SXA11_11260 [Cyanobacteriota bacterium]|nr:hypothetical protein [Cyanobacteriota bacterium]